ncbi:MAG: GGDEF domain-containing protein [Betaproteobacteria bacterium]|nr:GGDEF domain-containing protein [Betaproteobacteria bacterium]
MHLAPAALDTLAGCRLFAGVPAGVLRNIAAGALGRDVASGAQLITPGEPQLALYIVMRGELGVYADESARLPLLKIGPGDCAGEQTIFQQRPATSLVAATEPTLLLGLSSDRVWDAMHRAPVIALNMLGLLSERMREEDPALGGGFNAHSAFDGAARTDQLTGLGNRRWMEDAFERELLRCERAGTPAALLMIDIDRFKDVNNTVGRRVGDAVLARLAELLRRALRPRDLCARFGGEKFCVLLPELGARKALQTAERLRARIDAQPAQINRDVLVSYSVSIGVAEWRPGQRLDEMVRSAGEALGAAKLAGRNCVQLAGG